MTRSKRFETRGLPLLVALGSVPVTVLIGLIEGWPL